MPGRIRTIKPELLEDSKTSGLDDHSWRLFVSLLLLADDYGNCRGDVRYLDGQAFHSASGSFARTSRESREHLASVGLVTVYEVAGQSYLHINGWDKHQRVDHPGKPRCPGFSTTLAKVPESLAKVPESLATDPDLYPDHRPPTTDIPPNPPSGGSLEAGAIAQATTPIGNLAPNATPPGDPPTGTPAKRKRSPRAVEVSPEVVSVFDAWREALAPRAILDAKRATLIRRAIESFGVERCLSAIRGCSKSAWHCGANPEGKRYVGIELILRDAAHVERFEAIDAGTDRAAPGCEASDSGETWAGKRFY